MARLDNNQSPQDTQVTPTQAVVETKQISDAAKAAAVMTQMRATSTTSGVQVKKSPAILTVPAVPATRVPRSPATPRTPTTAVSGTVGAPSVVGANMSMTPMFPSYPAMAQNMFMPYNPLYAGFMPAAAAAHSASIQQAMANGLMSMTSAASPVPVTAATTTPNPATVNGVQVPPMGMPSMGTLQPGSGLVIPTAISPLAITPGYMNQAAAMYMNQAAAAAAVGFARTITPGTIPTTYVPAHPVSRPGMEADHKTGDFRCAFCNETFRKAAIYRRHLRLHERNRQHICDQCGKRFTQKGHLVIHQRGHSGYRPFVCPFKCDRAFKSKSDLRRHVRTHTGEKPFGCSQCQRTFSRKSNLTKHIERIHRT